MKFLERKNLKKMEAALFVFVTAQILYLLFYNLIRTQYAVNFDSSEYMIQAMQIWNQKTLLISDYYYSTMLTWDMSTLLAALFYGMTGNIFLSWGLANDILIILFVLVVCKLCKDLEFDRGATLLSLACIFTMYQFGPVDYVEELFINGALYGFRIMFMLAFMDIMICLHKGKKSRWNVLLYLLAFGGVFLCGLSTGIFAIGCCLLPILVGELWIVVMDKEPLSVRKFMQKPIVVMVLAMLVSLFGVVVNYLLGFSGSAASQKMTIPPEKMGDNLINIFVGLFELLGWPVLPVSIASISGGLAVLAAIVALCYLAAMGLTIYLAVRGDKEKDGVRFRFTIYTTWVILVNVALFLFADLTYSNAIFEYRYWVIVLIPLFIEIPIVAAWLRTRVPTNLRQLFSFAFVLTLFVITLAKDYKCYLRTDGNEIFGPVMADVNARAEEKGLDVIFVYSDWSSARTMCTYANKTTDYLAICNSGTDDTGMNYFEGMLKMPKWGTRVKYDGDCLDMEADKRVGILMSEWLEEESDFYIRRAVDRVSYPAAGHSLLTMDGNYLDFIYGVPEVGKDHSRDYFNWQYEKEGLALNENGEYQSKEAEGVVLSGMFVAPENGSYQAVLRYEVLSRTDKEDAAIGELVVDVVDADGNVRSVKRAMKASEDSVTVGFSLKEWESYTVSVEKREGVELVLKQVDYYRK